MVDSPEAFARKRELFVKATANSQRREREKLLSALPPELAEPLANVECVFYPDSESIMRGLLPITADGIGSPNPVRPRGYNFREVGWPGKAIEGLMSSRIEFDGSAYLLLGRTDGIWFNGQENLVPQVPLLCVDFQKAKGMLEKLWPFANNEIALIAQHLRAGMVIDSYSGILPEDPNPNEITFAVVAW